jgi:methionyl-tRNA synthetase
MLHFLKNGGKKMSSKGKFYMTTAIAYTSGKPHIGNTYEIILADAIARYKKAEGYDVYFQTGTDEHGQKIQEKAEAAGITPKQYVDEVAGEVKRIWDLVNASYDNFVRTTMRITSGACRKFLKNYTIRGTFTRVLMRDCIVRPASPSGPSRSL